MPKYVPFVRLAAVMVLAIAGCGTLKSPETAYVKDAPALMSYLDQQGVFYMADGPITAPQFSVPAQAFTVAGGMLEVFEYKSSTASVLDLSWMDDKMNGLAAPHLYRSDLMIVVYYGDDPLVQRSLSEAFGPPVG